MWGGSSVVVAFQLWISACLLLFITLNATPNHFYKGDLLKVKLKDLASTTTHLPYSYYSLPYCRPHNKYDEILITDYDESSPFVFKMQEPQMCNVVCRIVLNATTAKEFSQKIRDDYQVNMLLDNLSLFSPIRSWRNSDSSPLYQYGFRVGLTGWYAGSTTDPMHFIYNHLEFIVKFNKNTLTNSARIVGFEVTPYSVTYEYEGEWNQTAAVLETCVERRLARSDGPLRVEDMKEVIFTYNVNFQESDIEWENRWETYLPTSSHLIHWFSVLNSLLVLLFLSGMVAFIMLRTLQIDISNYNNLEIREESQENTGWKLVHADVFRPPTNFDWLCVYVGTGFQLLGMTLFTLVFGLLGLLSPSNWVGLGRPVPDLLLFMWIITGFFSGYTSTQLYNLFQGTKWKKIATQTAFFYPSITFLVFLILNELICMEKSSGAIPIGTMFTLVLLWFGLSVPFVFLGGYTGLTKTEVNKPVKTRKHIPRQIPKQTWYMNPVFTILVGGLLPFGVVSMELFFFSSSIWHHQFNYFFGFHFIAFVILIVSCCEISNVVLFSALQQRLSLVVAFVLDLWFFRLVCFLLFGLLFLNKDIYGEACLLHFVLWVHACCIVWIFCYDRYSRFLCVFLVHKYDIFVGKG